MVELWLIRHGETYGNAFGRYIGTTDEPLSDAGREKLLNLRKNGIYEETEAVFASPLKRTVETADLIFFSGEASGEKKLYLIPELAECDFGEFENKNYKELSGNKNYQQWIDSDGRLPFPGGESKETCRRRQLQGFDKAVEICIKNGIHKAALVIHGGTIMNIMEAYGTEKKSFYEWHVKNGEGYRLLLDESKWMDDKNILDSQKII